MLIGESAKSLDQAYDAYFAIQQALAADQTPKATDVDALEQSLSRLSQSVDVPDAALSYLQAAKRTDSAIQWNTRRIATSVSTTESCTASCGNGRPGRANGKPTRPHVLPDGSWRWWRLDAGRGRTHQPVLGQRNVVMWRSRHRYGNEDFPSFGGPLTMLNLLIRFCVKEPILVVMIAAALTVGGWFAFKSVPIDAIPNVGENQVIVLTPWPGRSPKDIEDQVTYPLSVSLLAVPGAESVRGKSMFGYSFVQVTFKDNVDFYWARSRVSEQLGSAASQLPDGVVPQLGPDATGLGQVYYYTLTPPPEGLGLAELRSLQDFVVKYELQAVEGVSEVASIGGYVRQYQIEVDPDKLRFHEVSLDKLAMAIKGSNVDVGAKTVETTGMEYIVRGKGFLGSDGDQTKAIRDIEDTVIMQRDGVPVRVSDVASVQLGPDFRRGALDYNGAEAVGGVVVMRYGENPRVVIDRVKAKIAQIEPALKGVKIHGVYDRSGLIDETMRR